MTYQKPELSMLGNAEEAILGLKDVPASDDGFEGYTIPAYEVDE
jgi:hypothetical protein